MSRKAGVMGLRNSTRAFRIPRRLDASWPMEQERLRRIRNEAQEKGIRNWRQYERKKEKLQFAYQAYMGALQIVSDSPQRFTCWGAIDYPDFKRLKERVREAQ